MTPPLRPIGHPPPFRQFIVKVHSRCDLSCDYCYIYRHVDQTWRDRPAVMSAAVVAALAGRIADHVRRHDLSEIGIVIHGGEPLLAGPAHLEHVVEAIRSAVPPAVSVRFTIQTNAVGLDEQMLDLFRRLGVRVGVSVDGGLAIHNRHRLFAHGGVSFDRVEASLARLMSPEFRAVYGGILCVVDLANDPLSVYQSLLAFAPPVIGLSLPHGNWVRPPPRRSTDDPSTPYGDWLVTVFDAWYGAPVRSTSIRLFDSIIEALLGGTGYIDGIGTAATDAVTVDTDGSIQHSDSLKTTMPRAAETGLTVVDDSFDAALALPAMRAERRSPATVPTGCQGCRVVGVCGGGLYAHRFHPVDRFDHRSVYCLDLLRLIDHIGDRVRADLAGRIVRLGQPPAGAT